MRRAPAHSAAVLALGLLLLLLPACTSPEQAEPLSGYMLLAGEVITDLPVPFEPALAALTAALADTGFGPPPRQTTPRREGTNPPSESPPPAAATSPDSDDDEDDTPEPFRVRRLREQDWLLWVARPDGPLTVIRLRAVGTDSTRLAIRVGSSGDEALSLKLLRNLRHRLQSIPPQPTPAPSPTP